MAATLTIGGTTCTMIEDKFDLTTTVDERQRFQCDVIDYSGTVHFTKGQSVVVTDPTLGTLFTGVLNTDKEKPEYPSGAILHSIDCIDIGQYAASKRTYTRTYTSATAAGKIAVDQVSQVLGPEGIQGSYTERFDTTATDFTTGSLSGVTGILNAGDGDLELSPAGQTVTYTDGSQLPSVGPAMKLVGTAITGYTNPYVYKMFWQGSISVAANSVFSYDIWIQDDCPEQKGGIDFIFTDGTSYRDNTPNLGDSYGYGPHPGVDLGTLAKNTWYSRSFQMASALVGKTIAYFTIAQEGDKSGTYTIYVRNVQFTSSGTTYHIFDATQNTLQTNVMMQNNGYINISLSAVQAYSYLTQNVGPIHSIDAVNIVRSSTLSWWFSTIAPTGTIPTTTTTVETSIDNGASWQTATNRAAIPNLKPGMIVTGRSLQYRVTSIPVRDPTVLQYISSIGITVATSYQASKSDVIRTFQTNADFTGGTISGLTSPSSGGISLNGVSTPFTNTNYGTITVYGNNVPSASLYQQQFTVSCGATSDSRARLDYAGQWGDCTIEVDFQIASGDLAGICYRTTGWSNYDGNYAYAVEASTSSLNLNVGANNGGASGSGSVTTIGTASIGLTGWHRLRVIATGSNHKVYLDNILYINVNDSTYTSAGYIALRNRNTTTNTISIPFANFGVVTTLSGTWQSPAISLSTVATYGSSLVQWNASTVVDSEVVQIQSSIDNGTSWQTITANGGSVPNLTAGQSLSGVNLLLKAVVSGTNATTITLLNSITAWILGSYSSSGTRSTAPLGNDTSITRTVGSGWGTAFDGQTWTQTGTGTTSVGSGEESIANTTGDVHMQLGSTTGTDEDGTVRFSLNSTTITGGMELRYTNTNNYYRLAVTTTTITILKNTNGPGGGLVTLATASVALSTGTWYRLRFRATGSFPVNLFGKVWTDGTLEPGVSNGVMSTTNPAWTITATD